MPCLDRAYTRNAAPLKMTTLTLDWLTRIDTVSRILTAAVLSLVQRWASGCATLCLYTVVARPRKWTSFVPRPTQLLVHTLATITPSISSTTRRHPSMHGSKDDKRLSDDGAERHWMPSTRMQTSLLRCDTTPVRRVRTGSHSCTLSRCGPGLRLASPSRLS